MIKHIVPWNLGDVAWVYLMRIAVVFVLGRQVFPGILADYAAVLEITDRLITVLLAGFIIYHYKYNIALFGLSAKSIPRNILWGLIAGVGLLFISIINESVMSTYLPLYQTKHPLLLQVEQAQSWLGLVRPLLLAGLAAPVAEELLYRVITYLSFKKIFGVLLGALSGAAIFALFHFNIYWLSEMVVVALGLTLLFELTGSIVSAMVAHSFVNTAKIILAYLQSGTIIT